MKAFLDALERFLTWFFAIAFGLVLVYAGVRYSHHREKAKDPWLLAQKANTVGLMRLFSGNARGVLKRRMPVKLWMIFSRVRVSSQDCREITFRSGPPSPCPPFPVMAT